MAVHTKKKKIYSGKKMKTGGTGHHRRILVGTAKTAHDLKRPFWFFFFVSLAKTKKKKP